MANPDQGADSMPRILLAALLALTLSLPPAAGANAAGEAERLPARPVQVFEVKAGKVVHSVTNDEEFQEMAREWLRSVTGLSPRIQPGEDCGFVYRVPLAEPSV